MRKRAGRTEDRLEIRIAEVLAEFEHELGEDAGLEKDGVERHLQEALAELPEAVERRACGSSGANGRRTSARST